MNVANGFTHFLQDFKLQGGKLRYGSAYLIGKCVIGCAVFVQTAGNLIQVAADFAVLGCEFPNSREQFIVDRGNGNDRAYSRLGKGLPDKFGLAHLAEGDTLGKLGVFFLVQACFDYSAAVGVLYLFMTVSLLFHGWIFFKRRKPQKGKFGVATPTRFPQDKMSRQAKFGTVVESCSKKLPCFCFTAFSAFANRANQILCSARCSLLKR